MMQFHVSGRLVRDPTPKTSAGGKAYVHALMTASSGDGETLITLMVFDPDLANLLASLRKGDSLSAIGSGSVRGYLDKDGQPAAGVTIMVNRLMTMTAKEAAPRSKGDSPGSGQRWRPADTRPGSHESSSFEAYDDPIPF